MVLVVVAMLTLGAYTFSEIMVTEVEATAVYGRQANSRAFAESGIEAAAAILGYPESDDDLNTFHNSGRYQGVLMSDSENARGRGYFSIVAPIESDPTTSSIRFGLMDESGRLNLNQLLAFELEDDVEREMLMSLPEMTEEIADSILDWLDDDFTPRDFGVESDYYEGLDSPYYAKDGNLDSIDELLQVAGVTPELLYGEDANRNGILDPNEDDGDASQPFDNADGILHPGWAAYLTIHSRELNLRSDGTERLFVNDGVLTDLYDALEEEFDEVVAQFVVAVRMNGPIKDPGEEEMEDTSTTDADSTSSTTDSGSEDDRDSSSGVDEEGIVGAVASLGNALAGSPDGTVTRGGMDLAGGADYELKSLYELVGSRVEVEIDGNMTILESPWTEDRSSMESYLPMLLDALTIVDESELVGRINVNQARLETLLGIPGMEESMAQAIVASPVVGSDGSIAPDALTTRLTNGWLVTRGIVDLKTMIELDKYVTGRGHVFRAQIVGFFEEGGGHTRLEAVLDGGESPVRVLSVSDLTELGRGYGQSVLAGTSDSSN